MKHATWIAVIAVLGACGKKSETTQAKHDEPAAAPAAPAAAASPPAAAPIDAAPAAPAVAKHIKADEAGRGGYACTFAGIKGDGADRSAHFTITMPAGRAQDASWLQAWVYYYDAKGAQVKSYPHATSYDGQPELALGLTGADLPKDGKTIECEITAVKFKDHSYWANANVVPCCGHDRPKGGVSDDDIKARAGEQVAIEVLDPKTGKLKLTSLSDQPIKLVGVAVFHFHDDGTYVKAEQNVEIALAPHASVEQTVELTGPDDELAEVKAAPASALEATAPNVTFADGKQWSNDNLENVPQP